MRGVTARTSLHITCLRRSERLTKRLRRGRFRLARRRVRRDAGQVRATRAVLGACLLVAVAACTAGPHGPTAATRSARSSAGAAPAATARGAGRPMLVWTPRHLPAGLAGRVARLPGVQRMVVVVNGTAWLTASFSALGRPVTRPPRGMAVPVDVTGADPSAYAAVAAPALRAAFAQLGEGTALLGATSARLRRLGAGG